ncbi:MAG: hypothetical protein JNM27_00890 [Leptospirales bacterium]|nr:hypothetical protein [Leptospirales bacterium]
MNLFRRFPLALGLVFSLTSALRALEISDAQIKKGIVLVTVTPVEEDSTRPWLKEQGNPQTRLGLVLSGKRILVLESDIRLAALIEVRKHSSVHPVTARLVRADREVDLAIITVEGDFFGDLAPLPFAPDAQPGAALQSVHIDGLFRVQRSAVTLAELETDSATGVTAFPIGDFSSIEPFPQGGLLVQDGKLAGFIHDRSNSKKLGFLFPSLLHSFEQQAAGTYKGFASIGFEYESLIDPALRKHYTVPETSKGPLVTRVLPGTSAFGQLQKGDVITAIDGIALDERGLFDAGVSGKQRLDLLFFSRRGRIRLPGEVLNLSVLRAGKPVAVAMTLKANEKTAVRVPALRVTESSYVVEGGLVFLELSSTYLLAAYGANYASVAPELAYLAQSKHLRTEPGDDTIVVLSRLYPDDSNLGYEQVQGAVVKKAADIPIHNLKHFRSIIEKEKGSKFLKLELSAGRVIYLDSQNRSAINKRIRERYGIPADARIIGEDT